MATRATVCSWDNSTRGLDASTALDYAKSLRILTDVFQQSTFVTLYQAGEGIYEQFDKVLVIDEGREVYFGPTKEARSYMVSLGYADLPRQTSADFLSGITDPNERQYQEGRDASNVPSTPDALEAAFKKSEIHARMVAERDAFKAELATENSRRVDFEAAVQDDKHRAVGKKSPYTVSFLTQVSYILQQSASSAPLNPRRTRFKLSSSVNTSSRCRTASILSCHSLPASSVSRI